MALRYTGRAAVFAYDGQAYRPGDIVPIPKADALAMAARTRLHTFEEVPDAPAAPKPGKAATD